ncbi:hypothetical protein Syun_013054 [Stephania yunnanensis]|uniref:Growth-regulating factor n=1 Tax=Stephania yunnanensis TaxID=152371 RepID=A0AAP0K1D9_9MAGN
MWACLGFHDFGVDFGFSVLGFRGVCFDYKNSMEAEPGRCRRTDGKKWRCSKEVVPDQKYCERHMHRGRNRSRKHVESTSQLSNVHTNSNSNNNNLSISMPLQLMTPNTTTTTTTTSFTHSHSFVQHNGICKAESTL